MRTASTGGRLVIATHNPGKLAEMRELLAPYGIERRIGRRTRLAGAGGDRHDAFAANARIKAEAAAQGVRPLPRSPTIPGSRSMRSTASPASTRRAGPGRTRISPRHGAGRRRCCSSAARRRRSSAARISSRRCASPGRTATSRSSRRRVDGTLVWPPRGDKGFGYDPMFLPDGRDRTFGEMTSEEKHGLPPRGRGLSHRARAFLKLAEACLAQTLTPDPAIHSRSAAQPRGAWT